MDRPEPSLWARYVTETFGGRTHFLEFSWGFISYSLPDGDSVFCEDIYIVPECRDATRAYQLLGAAEEAGLKAGKRSSVFIVRKDSPLAAQNLRIYLAMGFVPVEAESGNIWLKRQISPRKVADHG